MDKIKEFDGIELLHHTPYSPDLVPSDYYLFRSMAHFFGGRQFKDIEDVKPRQRNGSTKDYTNWPNDGFKP